MSFLSSVSDFILDRNEALIKTLSGEQLIVRFYSDRILRITLSTDGIFGNIDGPADFSCGTVTISAGDAGEYYTCDAGACVLRIYKTPLRFALYNKVDKTAVWEEASPLFYDEATTVQTLRVGNGENFYGGGMQNGYFSHTGKKLLIKLKIKHWNDGSVSNPAPFYMSTAGYGVFRNTFNPGEYDFTDTASIKLSHDKAEFDCFYFYGPTLPEILDLYTQITGRPKLIPRWGLWLGDADCYNTNSETYTGKHDKPGKVHTPDVMEVLARYRENKIPAGWVLPNDGYGCGYKDLEQVVREAWDKYGFITGLWTENGVEKIAHEVSVCGSRMCKLDVAWVGPGYKFALDASKSAASGIEDNTQSDDKTYSERAYIWSCCGWGGTQRYSTVWSGDQSGGWEYIRFHIPTYIGAGLSGMCFAGSDIDGIFGGTAKTYTRDIQWKALTPIMIAMSGWADNDKQPWVYGEPYTSINRKYLQLRQRLTPYLYTLSAASYMKGLPMVRAMLLEFPSDAHVWDKLTQYQFMCGPWLLVAPVFTDSEIRDGIYLPDGIWTDYHTGESYMGGRVLNNYQAPLDRLPLLIKSGAIIPMDAERLFDGQNVPQERDFLTLDIYPCKTTSFELYEDDGHTTLHRGGEYATTLIVSEERNGKAFFTVNPTEGKYRDMPFARKYEFIIHTAINPEKVIIRHGEAETCMMEAYTREDWESSGCCSWYYDAGNCGGTLHIKTKAMPLHDGLELSLDRFKPCYYAITDKEQGIVSDQIMPKTPAGLQITEVTDNIIALVWDASAGADYYEVETNGLIYSNLYDEFKHTDLKNLTEYSYRVRAVNSAGVSNYSESVTAVTLEDKMKNAVPHQEMYAYATSELSRRYAAKNLIDGEKATFWVSNYDDQSLPQSVTVDFMKIYEIDKLIFTPRFLSAKAVITKFDLAVSADGRNFERIIENGKWDDDGCDKEIILNSRRVRSVRLTGIETNKPEFQGASLALLNALKVPDSQVVLPGDYTGDGKVDTDDLNFVLQYYCSAAGDNSWLYVSKADTDGDGRIGIFDVAYTASHMEPKALPSYENKVSGSLHLNAESSQPEEEFKVMVSGINLNGLYAFEFEIDSENEDYTFVSLDINRDIFKHTASFIRDGKLYAAGTLTANASGICGDTALATLTLKARRKIDNGIRCSCSFIGSNLDIVKTYADNCTKKY